MKAGELRKKLEALDDDEELIVSGYFEPEASLEVKRTGETLMESS
jgi:hypothetical protein